MRRTPPFPPQTIPLRPDQLQFLFRDRAGYGQPFRKMNLTWPPRSLKWARDPLRKKPPPAHLKVPSQVPGTCETTQKARPPDSARLYTVPNNTRPTRSFTGLRVTLDFTVACQPASSTSHPHVTERRDESLTYRCSQYLSDLAPPLDPLRAGLIAFQKRYHVRRAIPQRNADFSGAPPHPFFTPPVCPTSIACLFTRRLVFQEPQVWFYPHFHSLISRDIIPTPDRL